MVCPTNDGRPTLSSILYAYQFPSFLWKELNHVSCRDGHIYMHIKWTITQRGLSGRGFFFLQEAGYRIERDLAFVL